MDIIKNEGVFRLYDKQSTVIFTDEKQLDRILEDPAKPLFYDEERGFSFERRGLYEDDTSLLSLVRQAKEQNARRIEASYDFFFGGSTRENYPGSQKTIDCFKVIHDVAQAHGMTFGASILNPLDIGGGYWEGHSETGFTYQFKETAIAPDGSYSAPMVCQKQWNNNKGPIHPVLERVLVFAFQEERIGDTPYFFVDPDRIVDISTTGRADVHEDTCEVSGWGYGRCKMEICGRWEHPTCDRALCVAVYRTPELDYFSDSAFAYMKQVLDRHNAAGIAYESFYSDEMHIQFDWDLVSHFGEDEINTRYLTPNYMRQYARLYGGQYLDFPKYLLYMAYHQHDFLPGAAGKENAQHVFGKTPEDVYRTWLFRNRYFELLQSRVVELCCRGKEYAEQLWGGPIMTRAHATWQESPTCDHYYRTANDIGGYNLADQVEGFADVTPQSPVERRAAFELAKAEKVRELGVSRYDYTPWYDWSSSIRENTAACYDYFKWNDYLSGGGNDHPEGGNLDRNYYGQALASSFGNLNRYEIAYCGGWGMPDRVRSYFERVGMAYGNQQFGTQDYNFVQGLKPRVSDVLALYPIALNNVEERFGSWMVQYGYCDYITQEKFLQNAQVTEQGTLRVGSCEYRALAVLFEPFLSGRTAALLRSFVEQGGKLVWMSIYPVLTPEGGPILDAFRALFGIQTVEEAIRPRVCKGKSVRFTGSFAGIADMPILNDYLVDFVYPFTPGPEAEVVAVLDGQPAAVRRRYPSGGEAVYAGFRLRDDQSGSLGRDVDTLFRVLQRVGAYREGSLEARSREPGAALLMQKFANGAVTAAPHYREVYEAWEGTFFREADLDAALLRDRTLPSRDVCLDGEVDGRQVRFRGKDYLAYNVSLDGELLGLSFVEATGITVDGRRFTLSDRPAELNFARVPERFVCDGVRRLYIATCYTEGAVLTLPVGGCDGCPPKVECCGPDVFTTERSLEHTYADGAVRLTIGSALVGKQIAVIF